MTRRSDPEYTLTIPEVAAIFGVTDGKIKKWVQDKKEHFHPGKVVGEIKSKSGLRSIRQFNKAKTMQSLETIRGIDKMQANATSSEGKTLAERIKKAGSYRYHGTTEREARDFANTPYDSEKMSITLGGNMAVKKFSKKPPQYVFKIQRIVNAVTNSPVDIRLGLVSEISLEEAQKRHAQARRVWFGAVQGDVADLEAHYIEFDSHKDGRSRPSIEDLMIKVDKRPEPIAKQGDLFVADSWPEVDENRVVHLIETQDSFNNGFGRIRLGGMTEGELKNAIRWAENNSMAHVAELLSARVNSVAAILKIRPDLTVAQALAFVNGGK